MKSSQTYLLTFVFSFFFFVRVHAQTVYITKTGTKYHVKKCPMVEKSGTKIELKKAIQDGYTACPNCGADKIKLKENVTQTKREEKDSTKKN